MTMARGVATKRKITVDSDSEWSLTVALSNIIRTDAADT